MLNNMLFNAILWLKNKYSLPLHQFSKVKSFQVMEDKLCFG